VFFSSFLCPFLILFPHEKCSASFSSVESSFYVLLSFSATLAWLGLPTSQQMPQIIKSTKIDPFSSWAKVFVSWQFFAIL
jgi:hypothetical protein